MKIVVTGGSGKAGAYTVLSAEEGAVALSARPDSTGTVAGSDSSRVPRADSARTPPVPPAPPMVTAQHLTPAKARILLMVALTRTKDPREIQQMFQRY